MESDTYITHSNVAKVGNYNSQLYCHALDAVSQLLIMMRSEYKLTLSVLVLGSYTWTDAGSGDALKFLESIWTLVCITYVGKKTEANSISQVIHTQKSDTRLMQYVNYDSIGKRTLMFGKGRFFKAHNFNTVSFYISVVSSTRTIKTHQLFSLFIMKDSNRSNKKRHQQIQHFNTLTP